MTDLEIQPVSADVKHALCFNVFQQYDRDKDVSILIRWRTCKIMNMSDAWEIFWENGYDVLKYREDGACIVCSIIQILGVTS